MRLFFTLHIYWMSSVSSQILFSTSVQSLIPLNCQWLHVNLVLFYWILVFSLQTLWRISMRLQRMRQINVTGRKDVWNLWSQRRLVGLFFVFFISFINILHPWISYIFFVHCCDPHVSKLRVWDWLYHTSSCTVLWVCVCLCGPRGIFASTFPVTEAHSLEPIWINI